MAYSDSPATVTGFGYPPIQRSLSFGRTLGEGMSLIQSQFWLKTTIGGLLVVLVGLILTVLMAATLFAIGNTPADILGTTPVPQGEPGALYPYGPGDVTPADSLTTDVSPILLAVILAMTVVGVFLLVLAYAWIASYWMPLSTFSSRNQEVGVVEVMGIANKRSLRVLPYVALAFLVTMGVYLVVGALIVFMLWTMNVTQPRQTAGLELLIVMMAAMVLFGILSGLACSFALPPFLLAVAHAAHGGSRPLASSFEMLRGYWLRTSMYIILLALIMYGINIAVSVVAGILSLIPIIGFIGLIANIVLSLLLFAVMVGCIASIWRQLAPNTVAKFSV